MGIGEDSGAEVMLKIGDIVVIKRIFDLGNETATVALKCEGFMDALVVPQLCSGWLGELELCLFKVEVPMAAGTAKSTRLEEKAIKTANLAAQGTVVKYGQQVQLRHLHSGGHLSLALCSAAREPGTFSIVVSQSRDNVLNIVTLQPDSKLQKIGEPIRYWDRIEIIYQEGNLKHYLHLHQPKHPQDYTAVVGSLQPSAWSFYCFEDVNNGDASWKCGSLVQVQLMNSVLHLSEKKGTALLRGDKDDYAGYWIAERNLNTIGEAVHFGEIFYLKNAKSGLYLSSDLRLYPEPQETSALYLPKPESFKKYAEISYNFPVLVTFELGGGKLASAVTERKEEIMSDIMPNGGSQSNDSLILEAALTIDMTQGKDVLFHLDPMDQFDANFLMQMSKLVPRLESFRSHLEQALQSNTLPGLSSEIQLVEAVLKRASLSISQTHNPDILERRQSIVCGMEVHISLINIAYTVFKGQRTCKDLQKMVRSIWTFLLEVVANNEYSSRQVELQKELLIVMVPTEKQLIGNLLTEIYRLVDPEMPNYSKDFKDWCDKLETPSEDNVTEQTVFLKLLKCLIEVGDNVKIEYQKVVFEQLVQELKFPLVRIGKERGYFVQLYVKGEGVSLEEFERRNPSVMLEAGMRDVGACVSLDNLSRLPTYIDYVSNAILLLQALCKGKFEAGKSLAQSQGLTSDLIMELLQQQKLHLKLREALLLVAESLFVSCPPYLSTLQRKKENFCYSIQELTNRKDSVVWTSPLESDRLHTPEVTLCLHLTLSPWMQRELPGYLKGAHKLHILTYLTACLKVAHSLVDFDHCSQVYARSLGKGLGFLLQGLKMGKEEHRRHWAVALVQSAVKDAQHIMDLRVQTHELFRILVQLLTAVSCVTRQYQLTQLASACTLLNFDELMSLENSEITELIDKVNEPFEGLQTLRRMMGPMSSFRQDDDLNTELTPQPSMRLSHEILLKGMETHEALFRLLLSWESIEVGIRDAVIVFLRQSYDRKSTIAKHLQMVDVLTDPKLLGLYEQLRRYAEQHQVGMLAQDCRFEARQGRYDSLLQLCQFIRYILNFVLPQSGHTPYVIEKMQNVLRHLSLHKQVMSLWPLALYLTRLPKSPDFEQTVLRLTTLIVCFLTHFCRNNSRNRAELLYLFDSNYYDLKVPQYAELLREMTDFEVLNPDNCQRLVTYLLDSVDSAHSSAFLRIVMYRRNGQPREDLQNLVARLVAAKVAKTQEPELLLTLAAAAYSNSHAVVLCRALKSVEELGPAAKDAKADMLEALFAYLYTVYLRAYSTATSCAKDTLAFIPIMQNCLRCLQPVFSGEVSLEAHAKEGRVEQVFPKENPCVVEEMKALEPHSDMRMVFRLLRCLTELLPNFLPALTDRTHLALPTVNDVKSHFQSLLDTIKTHQADDLDYTSLLTSLENSIKACSSFISKHEGTEERRKFNIVARMLAQTVKRTEKTEDVSSESYHIDERLVKLNVLYSSRSRTMDESYLNDLAKVFLSVVFPSEIPVKLPREASDTLVKMLIRLQRTFAGTHHRAFYFNFLKKLVPTVESPSDRRRKYVFNPVFVKAGVVEEAVLAITEGSTLAEANAALSFLNELMQEQSKEFQDEFMALLDNGEKSYYLFARVKTELEHVKARILEQTLKGTRKSLFQSLDQQPVQEERLVTELIEEGASGRDLFVINSLVLLQLCCDNCNVDFQDYIRQQRKQAGLANVDLISEVATFVIDLSSAGEYVKESRLPSKMLVKSLAALLDFVTGPCPGNQVALGNHVPLYLAINKMISFTSFEISKPANKIHEKVSIFMHTFLEGTPDPSIAQAMVNFLDLKMMREAVVQFYETHIRGNEEDYQLELSTLDPLITVKLHSMLLQAIFLIKLKRMHKGHQELKKFRSSGLEEQDAYNFYIRYIGYVEIDRAGVVESHYFPLPFKSKYLTFASRQWILFEVDRRSHQKKIEDFMAHVGIYMREMQHQQLLSRSRGSKALISRWKFFAQLSFLVVLLINIQLLFTFEVSVEASFHNHPINRIIIQAMNILELLLYMVSFLFNMLEYFPNKIAPQTLLLGAEIDRYHQFPHNESQYLRLLYQDLGSEKVQRESFEAQIKEIFSNLDFYYNYVYFLTAVVAIYYPIMCPVLLLDLVKQNTELVNVLKSVTVNLRQLVITLILGMIIIFLFSVYAFVFFQDYYDAGDGLLCHDVLNCFMSTMSVGVRSGGGIGDRLIHPDHNGEDYWVRMTFDMLFFLVVIIVLLSIIFGIIIDTFAQLRNQRSFVLEAIHTRCYVCGSERSEVELRGKGWAYHFMVEHSPLAYLAFLVYLLEMPTVDCSGIEKYVKEKFEKRDYTFMPSTSRLLQTSSSH